MSDQDLEKEWTLVREKLKYNLYNLSFNYQISTVYNEKKSRKHLKTQKIATNEKFLVQRLIEQTIKIDYEVKWLFKIAKEHDFTGFKANGYYSMIRITILLYSFINKRFTKMKKTYVKSKEKDLIDLINLISYFLYLLSNMKDMFNNEQNIIDNQINNQNEINNQNNFNNQVENKQNEIINHTETNYQDKSLFNLSLENFEKLNTLTLDENSQKALSLVYGKFGIFWYSKSMQAYYKLLRHLIIFSTSNPFRSFRCLINEKQCGENLARKCANSTVEYVTRSLSFLELKVYNRIYFSLINLKKTNLYKAKTVFIKVQTEFKVPKNIEVEINNNSENLKDNLLALKNKQNTRKIRCRLLKGHKKKNLSIDDNSNKCIVFHVHGGGFIVTSPDSHEIYLRKWATKLNGIPILSVDYQLRAPYPQAIQDILDVYLKLFLIETKTDSNDNFNSKLDEQEKIKKIFGFLPKNVILVGDSCGGNLILSLLCCLNDLRHKYQLNFIMPFALTAIYPVFDLRAVCSPSKFIGALDPILHSGNLMAMHGCYGGLNEGATECNSLINRFKKRHVKPWFVCTNEQCSKLNEDDFENKNIEKKCIENHVKNKFNLANFNLNGPFASPATYSRLTDFADIKLDLIASHMCPLLDDAIEMYKKWPGLKTFECFDNLPHGFIQFVDLSPSCKKASKKILQTIKNTIEQHFDGLNHNLS